MTDDAQAQNASFPSSDVQRLVDGGRRQEKFQRLTASNSGRHLRQRVPVDSFVGHSVDGDTGEASSPTSAARDRQRPTTHVDAHTGADHGNCRLSDDAELKPKLSRLLSSATGHYITTAQCTV